MDVEPLWALADASVGGIAVRLVGMALLTRIMVHGFLLGQVELAT